MTDKKDSSKSPRYTNGPVVKTGPTSGQNRARNSDGSWHKKRSDTGKSRKKSGCFVTTAVCQHRGLADDCYELETLRAFRDHHLLATAHGRDLVDHYYSVAPAIADRLVDLVMLDEVWEAVQRCVRAIERREFDYATSEYTKVVLALQHSLIEPEA